MKNPEDLNDQLSDWFWLILKIIFYILILLMAGSWGFHYLKDSFNR